MRLKLAVATEDFGQQSLRQSIRHAAQCRVQGLRLNARTEVKADSFGETALRQLRHFVEEHQLRVAGLMYSTRHSLIDSEKMDQRLDGIRSACTLVRRLGTSELLIRVGRIPDPQKKTPAVPAPASSDSDVNSLFIPISFASTSVSRPSRVPSEADQFDLLCDVLNDLAGHAGRHGAILQLIVSGYETERISLLLSRISAGPVGLVFDSATCLMAGQNSVDVYRQLYQNVGYIRLRDAQKDIDGGGIETRHGDGAVDWMELLPMLAESEFSGWVCAERTGGDQRSSDVEHAVDEVRRLFPVAP